MTVSARVHSVVRLMLAGSWGVLVLFVLADNVADHPLRHSLRLRRNLVAVSPQGWAFFTRDPREPVDRVYLQRGGRLVEADYTNTSGRNLWGLRRAARGVAVELAALLAQIPDGQWSDCSDSPPACVASLDGAPPTVANSAVRQSLCGTLVVVRRPPVPWAWSRSPRPIHMPGKVVRLTAHCGRQAGRSV